MCYQVSAVDLIFLIVFFLFLLFYILSAIPARSCVLLIFVLSKLEKSMLTIFVAFLSMSDNQYVKYALLVELKLAWAELFKAQFKHSYLYLAVVSHVSQPACYLSRCLK